MIVAERPGVILRHAQDSDLPEVDRITIVCYEPIQESYVAMLGEECYEAVRPDPELTWQQRKIGQVRRLYGKHPERLWVLEESGDVIGYVTFELRLAANLGVIANNGVLPEKKGRGLGRFMYRQVLRHFREQGLRFAHVDTGLDDAHIAARRAYEAVGFDRKVPMVDYWQDLDEENPGSAPA
jgi:ribosomal protein S18 acetylase RimI-like enzyme